MFRWKQTAIQKDKAAKQLKNNWTAYILLGLAMGAMTFFGVCNPGAFQSSNGQLGGDAAVVMDSTISRQEFMRNYNRLYDQYAGMFQQNFSPGQMKLAKNTLDQLIDNRITYLLALSSGFYASEDAVDEALLESLRDESGKINQEFLDNLAQNLRYQGLSEQMLHDETLRSLVTQRYYQTLILSTYFPESYLRQLFELQQSERNVEFIKLVPDQVKVSISRQEVDEFIKDSKNLDKIKKYYEDNKNDFNKPKKVKASHILIAYKGAERARSEAAEKRTKEQAEALAKKLAEDLHKDPKKFSEYVDKYSDDLASKTKKGDLGFFEKETMVKEFSDVAFQMKKGDISDPVASKFGYHIIYVTDIQEAVSKSLEDAKVEIAKKLIAQEKKPLVLKRRAERFLAAAQNKTEEKRLLKELGLKWEKTGMFTALVSSIPHLGSDVKLFKAVFKLKDKNELYPEPIQVNDSYIILRLVDVKKVDWTKFNDQEKKRIKDQEAMSQAQTMHQALVEMFKQDLKKRNKIWINDSYLAIDQRSTQQGG